MTDSPSPLEALHRQVSEAATALAERFNEHSGHPTRCGRGCTDCCQDGLTVFEIEAEHVRAHHGALLASGDAGPEGACAFLGASGACRIYEQRPYVCRTQGHPLRWLEPDGEGGGLEYRDICPRNESEQGLPLVELDPDLFWTIGSWEAKLRLLQELRDGGEGKRVPLRELFTRP